MNQVGIAELKARLSEYVSRVREGEEIIVSDRGRPVARLVPVRPGENLDEDARLRDLERRGIVRRGSGTLPDDFFDLPRPSDPQAAARRALEEERAEGR